MGLAKKNKRKLVFQDQEFYWWVKEEFDGYKAMLEINIATGDKTFLVKYFVVQQQEANRYIIVLGSSFPGLERKTGNWKRFVCPDFVSEWNNHGIGPKNIKMILEWCFDADKELIPVNYKGELE